jgi:ribosomal-protein-alanine N-acetyltransferase
VAELELLRLDHAPALLAFERENRAYFAKSIPDRGDEYFAEFDARHRDRLAEQDAGLCFFHLLVNSDGEVLGRINLVDVADGSAELGTGSLKRPPVRAWPRVPSGRSAPLLSRCTA